MPESQLSGATVLLTGATGFVGSEIARQLLQHPGVRVLCPVRSAPDAPRIVALKRAFDGLPGEITFVQADIRSEEQLAAAASEAVNYVIHVASPFVINSDDPQRDIVDPAVEGTAAVLRAAARHKDTLKRVVVTSSVCAIHDCNRKQQPAAGPGQRYTEEDWNLVSTHEAEPYWVSKVEAERTAWRLAEELGLQLSTVLPNFIMGPVAVREAAEGLSVSFFKGFVEASAKGAAPPSGTWAFSDVRDVARAHILAAVTPAAAGRRYIISQPRDVSARTVTDILKRGVPQLAHLPDGAPGDEDERIDPTRVTRELGLDYTPLERTLTDMAVSLIGLGIAAPATAPAS